MNRELYDKVEQIHASDAYGAFVEFGAGCPLAGVLYALPGASRTVYMTEQPYAKEYQRDRFFVSDRSVSMATVRMIVNRLSDYGEHGVNLFFCASFQVAHKGACSTHGWVALRYKNDTRYYHMTLHTPHYDKMTNIESIGGYCVELLHAAVVRGWDAPRGVPVDMVYDDRMQPMYAETVESVSTGVIDNDGMPGVAGVVSQSVMLVSPDGAMARLEDLQRSSDALVLYKGTFNPPTVAHVHLVEQTRQRVSHDDTKTVFVLSENTYQKGHQSAKELAFRIRAINKMGYWVAVMSRPLFVDTVSAFRQKIDLPLYIPMGADTYERLAADYDFDPRLLRDRFASWGATLVVQQRSTQHDDFLDTAKPYIDHFIAGDDSVSSTRYRDLMRAGAYDEAGKLVPYQIRRMAIEHYKQ